MTVRRPSVEGEESAEHTEADERQGEPACCSIVITAVYILRVVGKILYGTCTNEHHLKLTDATWDERFSVICLILAVAGLGLAPLWVSNMIEGGVAPIVDHIHSAAVTVSSCNPFL